jgi:hypothetical protein
MSAATVLRDPEVAPSVAWKAVKKLLGVTCEAWEFDTIRIELGRRNVDTTDSLMAKLFGAMTIATSNAWTYDHDVFFAFAVACSGVSADAEALHHPTPEELCWAVSEIHAIRGIKPSDDEGFDPDTIDPAIAVVLHDDGYVVAPDELEFAQDALDKLNKHGANFDLKSEVLEAWKTVGKIPLAGLHKQLSQLDEEPAEVQIHRLGDCKLYVAERELTRAKQHAALDE